MADQNVAQQVEQAWVMSDEDLYRHLGMASLGTSSFTESIGSMKMLVATANNTDANLATKSLGDNLLNKGKVFFAQTLDRVKGLICTIYNGNMKVGDKDLAAYIVAAIVAAGTLTNALAVLIVTIAVKQGLTKLCA
jgi:hypothetical protein